MKNSKESSIYNRHLTMILQCCYHAKKSLCCKGLETCIIINLSMLDAYDCIQLIRLLEKSAVMYTDHKVRD